MRRLVLTLATLAVGLLTLAVGARPASAARTVDYGWGSLTVVDYADAPGPGGTVTVRFRDTRTDGSCVRVILVNEDGSRFRTGPRSCGRTVRWVTRVPAEDWPTVQLLHTRTGSTVPS